jgi:hypothetical protein
MKYFIYPLSFLLFSCTDLLLHDSTYHSLSFNGGAWIEFEGLDLQNNFTIEFWTTGGQVNSSESPALISIGNQDSIQFALYRHPNIKSQVMIELNNNLTNTTINSLDTVNTETFNFIAISKYDTFMNIHINGLDFQTEIDFWDVGSTLYIGAVPYLTMSNFWIGIIDEIRFWDTNLDSEILEFHAENPNKLFQNENNDIEDNIIAHWRLEYTEPSSIVSDSKNNFDGVIKTLPGYSVELSSKFAQ